MVRLDADTTLRQAIEHLYETFARYPLRANTEPCEHCLGDGFISEDAEARLHATPLRELVADDLERFALDVLYTWGTDLDFRYFLPRILELVASWEFVLDNHVFWVVCKKLPYAGWRNWPRAEQEAIEQYFIALWRWILTLAPSDGWAVESFHYPSESRLVGIANAVDDLRPYLDGWGKPDSPTAPLHLAAFITWHADDLTRRGAFTPYWDERPEQIAQVVRWLRDERTVRLLDGAAQEAPDEERRSLLTAAAATLRGWDSD